MVELLPTWPSLFILLQEVEPGVGAGAREQAELLKNKNSCCQTSAIIQASPSIFRTYLPRALLLGSLVRRRSQRMLTDLTGTQGALGICVPQVSLEDCASHDQLHLCPHPGTSCASGFDVSQLPDVLGHSSVTGTLNEATHRIFNHFIFFPSLLLENKAGHNCLLGSMCYFIKMKCEF